MNETIPRPLASPARRRRRIALWAVAIAVLAALASSVGAAAMTYSHQQSALSRARADRLAAQRTLDAALAHARGDGLSGEQLAPVAQGERVVLAQAASPSRYRYFDGGEIQHLTAEAGALRALIGRLDRVEADATDAVRLQAGSLLDNYDAAIAAKQRAGLDATADLAASRQLRTEVASARSPMAVETVITGIPDAVSALQREVQAKLASDAASAAAAKLDNARSDASGALSRGDRLLQQAQHFPQLQVADAATMLQTQHQAFGAATTAEQFDAVNSAATDAGDAVAGLLTARSAAYSQMATARNAVQQAIAAKVDPGGIPAELDSLQPQLDGAGTVAAFNAIADQMHGLVAPLLDKVGVADVGVGKVIVLRLSTQHLTAYQDGASVYSTDVTTGRPELPTPTGQFTVLRKNNPWEMVSDWPRSSPYWYPPSRVNYVLWFTNQGHGIHDAPWRSTYGPGTEAQGSHGCVNVPMPIMASLFGWADVGTRVLIQN